MNKTKDDIELKIGKVYISAEAFTDLVRVINTYGKNKKLKAAADGVVAKVNSNMYGPVIVTSEIEFTDSKK